LPSTVVNTLQSENITSTKRQLKSKVKQHILNKDSATRKAHLNGLQVQGRVFRSDTDLSYWTEAASSLLDREMKFAYNAAIDTLPSNANLALWYRGQVSAHLRKPYDSAGLIGDTTRFCLLSIPFLLTIFTTPTYLPTYLDYPMCFQHTLLLQMNDQTLSFGTTPIVQ
jgi:hypothetical protein